jgi:hypothetical protein
MVSPGGCERLGGQEHVPTTTDAWVPRSFPRSAILHKVGPPARLSPTQSSWRRHPKNRHLHSVWALWVPYNAIRIDERAGVLSVSDEPCLPRPCRQVHGAELRQNVRPIAFESRKLSSAEINYPIHEKEQLVVVYALQKWHIYLHSTTSPFTIYTDHESLK